MENSEEKKAEPKIITIETDGRNIKMDCKNLNALELEMCLIKALRGIQNPTPKGGKS